MEEEANDLDGLRKRVIATAANGAPSDSQYVDQRSGQVNPSNDRGAHRADQPLGASGVGRGWIAS